MALGHHRPPPPPPEPPMRVGDVVEFLHGQWVIVGQVENPSDPAARSWRLRRTTDRFPTQITAGEGDLKSLERPVFTPGQKVRYAFAHDGEAVY